MGVFLRFSRAALFAAGVAGMLSIGCAPQQQVSINRLIRQQAMLDFSGLKDPTDFAIVKSRLAVPEKWDQLVPKKTSLYTDVQWRAPSRMSAVGIAYVKLPIPVPAGALMWIAKGEYTKKQDDGKLIGEWTDAMGRPWFEAENKHYHVKGFILSRSFDAWIVYAGYKTEQPPNPSEMALAQRSMKTAVPIVK